MQKNITIKGAEDLEAFGRHSERSFWNVFEPETRRAVLWLCLGAVYWWGLFQRLTVDWSINPQYGYGWSVPALACWLAWRRWADRPRTEFKRWRAMFTLGCLVLLFVLFPVRMIEEANPEWRLVLWFHAFALVGLSAGLLFYSGGKGWLRHFAFPVCFVLISVPWPTNIEQGLIQGLTRIVAGATVGILRECGITALQHGNLIEIGTGVVGVDEACSGIRSLQTSVMISLFLGELHRFTTGRRLFLVALGVGLAVMTNLCRTLFLVWNAAQYGIASVSRWHDAAGMIIVGVVLAGLWLLALWLKEAEEENRVSLAPVQKSIRVPPYRPLAGVSAWWVLVLAATQAWYRAHERELILSAQWSVQWPTACPKFRDVPLAERARSILRCDRGQGAAWKDEAQNFWLGFFLEWEPGRNSAQLAKGHTPDICMPATGRKLVRELEVRVIPASGLELPFRCYEFNSEGRPLFVFYCDWESARSSRSETLREDWTVASRFNSVLAGKRHLGEQVLQLAVRGPRDIEQAEVALRRELQTIVQPKTASVE
jgi:exosortase